VTRAHDAAVLSRLREIRGLSELVFDGEPKGTKQPDGTVLRPSRYVNVHSNRGIGRPDRLAQATGGRKRKTYWIHSVGASKQHADAVAEAVIAALEGWSPAVDGFSCERLSHETSQPTQKEETSKPAIFFAVDVFDLYTTPLDPTL